MSGRKPANLSAMEGMAVVLFREAVWSLPTPERAALPGARSGRVFCHGEDARIA
jgi:hypothetical protein